MLEESVDPRPAHDAYARFMALHARECAEPGVAAAWLRSFSDDRGLWHNLRDLEHWIERSRR